MTPEEAYAKIAELAREHALISAAAAGGKHMTDIEARRRNLELQLERMAKSATPP